jgi:DNA-binding transcriptional ArsR family regulator
MNVLASFRNHHEIFKALSEPIRLRIAVLLARRELCVCDLTAALKLPQPTVSRHINKMRSAGLILSRRDGRWIHCRLASGSPLDELRGYLIGLTGGEPFSDDLARLIEYQKEKRC